jgi:DNA-binding MarR family transcriptional regulator
MSNEIKEIQEKVLIFLYWEGTVDPNYLSVRKIESETELSSSIVEIGLKTLHQNGWVECNIRKSDLGIEDVRITGKGIEKIQSLISLEDVDPLKVA